MYSTQNQQQKLPQAESLLVDSEQRKAEPRLIVVSNRVASNLTGNSGGLAVALLEAIAASGGLWFGWSGKISAAAHKSPPKIERDGNVVRATIDLTPEEAEGYYRGFSNGCLWPALHYRLDIMKHVETEREQYQRVNTRFATNLVPLLHPGDLVWVHDFHLIPLARELRQLGRAGAIGFFLHTPFPAPEIFASIPGHRHLARTLMAYNVIGFQTKKDRANFSFYLKRFADGHVLGPDRVKAFGRVADVVATPVGIDIDAVRVAARLDGGDIRAGDLQDSGQLIIGVDRLDYTKGIPERLNAFERLLEHTPEHRGNASLLQIAPPTREGIAVYEELTQEVQRVVGSINGRFGTLDWTPVTFINRPVPRETLLGLLRRARVGLVTPLRDGMNLVAKEFVAAQDEADPGVLLLSQFAGAAEEMTAALPVNPHDIDMVADALHRALVMPLAQRQARHQRLYAQVARSDVNHWRSSFLKFLSAHSNIPHDATGSIMVGAA